MEERRDRVGNRVERTHRALPPVFESLHAPPHPMTPTSASTEDGERAPPVSLPHFGRTNPSCRSATTGRAWYDGATTVVGHGPAIAPRRLHRRCEIFGRWRTQMGDWPALSMSANSAQRRQCSVPNGVPGRVNLAFVWRARLTARASGWEETASRDRRYAQFVSRCVLQIGGCTVWRIAGGGEGVSNWHKGCLIRDQKRRALVVAIGGQR
jgi:hypothetical protein